MKNTEALSRNLSRNSSEGRNISVPQVITGRAKSLYIYPVFQSFRSHEAEITRDSPRSEVVSVHVNGSSGISGAWDNFVHALLGYLAPLPETSWVSFYL